MRYAHTATILAVVSSLLLAAILGCKPKEESTSAKPPPPANAPVKEEAPPPEPAPAEATPAETEKSSNPTVEIDTTKGKIVAELHADAAPKTVANFLALAKAGYYDNMVWHRVVPGFVIQTGDGPKKPTIPDEVNVHKHQPGALAMAKPGSMSDPSRLSAPDSASTQFYISLGDREKTKHLNEEFTVFGQVTEGMEVAEKITQKDKVKTIKVIKADA
jgi:cyclophilin family peptidyl-prolyl cis-trans isomerase